MGKKGSVEQPACLPAAATSELGGGGGHLFLKVLCEKKKTIQTVIFAMPPELEKGVSVCLVLMNCTNSCLLSRLLYALFYS